MSDIVTQDFKVLVSAGETFADLIAKSNYGWVNPWVTAQRFPVQPQDPCERKIVLLNFGREKRVVTLGEAIAEARERRLVRPTHVDCLRFGAQHPGRQIETPVLFPHEPVEPVESGAPDTLFLNRIGGRNGKRRLHCGWSMDSFTHSYWFAFIDPS